MTEIVVEIECLKQSESLWKVALSTNDEPSVSSLWLGEYPMRCGITVLRMVGNGGVDTDEAYRNRGFARRIMDESTAWMQDQDF